MSRFLFPAWIDRALPAAIAFGVAVAGYGAGVGALAISPVTLDVGYQPKQPIPFSHALHAGKLKMDCRYCHNTVEKSAKASIPANATCAKCHAGADNMGIVKTVSIHSTSPKLLPVRESQATGKSVPWIKVHDLPDYAYFNHSAHVTRGVSCVSCHGRVDRMEEVVQIAPLSMGWCLECHRNPGSNLRPPEKVTALDWVPEEPLAVLGARIKDQLHIESKTNCSTCHR